MSKFQTVSGVIELDSEDLAVLIRGDVVGVVTDNPGEIGERRLLVRLKLRGNQSVETIFSPVKGETVIVNTPPAPQSGKDAAEEARVAAFEVDHGGDQFGGFRRSRDQVGRQSLPSERIERAPRTPRRLSDGQPIGSPPDTVEMKFPVR